MDPNLTALLTVVVTSITTIIITLINYFKATRIEKKVDAGNAMTDSVHTVVNGRTDRLERELAAANKEIQRQALLLQPKKK